MQYVFFISKRSIIAAGMPLLHLLLFIGAGILLAASISLKDLQNMQWYPPLVALLLAVGLYASTYGINLKEARKHLKIIISAVTIGVVIKSLISGSILAFVFKDPFFFILGVVVAQIDPLSVAGLMKGNRLSKRAKTVLASWASFDDPITVLLALYVPVIVMQLSGAEMSVLTNANSDHSFWEYIKDLGLNLGLAAQAFCLYTVIRFYSKRISAWIATGVSLSLYVLLALLFSVSVIYFMMLGIALIGLFLRPPKVDVHIDTVITWALRISAIILGILLIGGIDLGKGIALGVAGYTAQIIVGFLLTSSLPKRDRWHIAFAQQNGITAIILALLFEPIYPGTVAIVGPAIIVINTLHWLSNICVDKYVLNKR